MALLSSVSPRNNISIYLVYDDGTEGEYCLEKIASQKEFEALKDEEFFMKVGIDPDTNDVVWPGNISLCKNAIYKQLHLINLMSRLKINIESE